jgi:hypothetical protein
MSPELHFLLSLALRMAVSAAFVVSASIITERAGPAIGALVATLPVSAGPAYLFLALDHNDAFIAQSALASLPMNAASVLMMTLIAIMAQRFAMPASLCVGLALWLVFAALVRLFDWTFAAGIALNVISSGLALWLVRPLRAARMPLITRRWYDIPVRAALVATVVAAVVIASNVLGPRVSGAIALFPVVTASLVLILMPRIGGKPTAALLANSQWGMIGFALSVMVLHVAAQPLGRAVALVLALATGLGWNVGLWLYQRRRLRRPTSS